MRRALWTLPALALAACGTDDGATTATTATATGSGATGGAAGAGGSTGSGGAGATGSGGAGLSGGCGAGDEIDCYSGPAGTADVGACKSGKATCLPDGTGFGACEGDVTPQPETCTTPVDDDCDGETNEAGDRCACKPGSSAYCYTGAPETENIGPCVGGIKTCNAEGTAWGPCENEVTPVAEDCSTPALDEDCDGATPACPAAWVLSLGDASEQTVHGVAVSAAGDVFVAGELAGTAVIGADTLTSAGLSDAFVVKLDAAGNVLWTKRAGNAELQAALAIAVDGAGDVWTTGFFRGTIDFGGGVLTSLGAADVFLAKLSGASGAQLFAQRYGNSADEQIGSGIAVDATGNVLLTGHFAGQIGFGGATFTSAGTTDVFVAKLSSTGMHQFSNRFGDLDLQRGRAIAAGPAGEIWVAGELAGTIDFGAGALTSAGQTDAFLAAFDGAGSLVWAKRCGDAGAQTARAIALGPGGGPVVAGDFAGSIDFGGGALGSAGQLDAFVAELAAADGSQTVAARFGGLGDESVFGVAVDPAGFLLLAGYTTGTIDFGNGVLTSTGGRDGFVAKLDATAGPYWSRLFGDATFYQEARSVAVDAGGNVVVGGHFSGGADLGAGVVTSAGSTDGFVAQYPP